MDMDVLRCKSPDMVRKEIAVFLLTYNLVRWSMMRAAQLVKVAPRDLSFTGARRLLLAFASRMSACFVDKLSELTATLLRKISECVLPKRPGRIEPRAKKRRPKPLPLLTLPRVLARQQIRAQFA
ncbi:hypothetical protein B9Z48_20150 [Limnohabitans sp. WS1]|nr:hypothetical protein B9Z48_20150 [Limnohabitans sp. WS1]